MRLSFTQNLNGATVIAFFLHNVRPAGNFTPLQATNVRRGSLLQRSLRVYVVYLFTGVLSLGSRFQGHKRRCAAAGGTDRGWHLHSSHRLRIRSDVRMWDIWEEKDLAFSGYDHLYLKITYTDYIH